AGEDDAFTLDGMLRSAGLLEKNDPRGFALRELDSDRVAVRPNLAVSGGDRLGERRDREIALGVDRTLVRGAEAAVGAAGPTIVRAVVDRDRRRERIQAQSRGRVREDLR